MKESQVERVLPLQAHPTRGTWHDRKNNWRDMVQQLKMKGESKAELTTRQGENPEKRLNFDDRVRTEQYARRIKSM